MNEMSDYLFRVSVWATRSRLRSEILFNRVLIWIVVAIMESRAGNKVTTWLAIVSACIEAWNAINAWIEANK